MIRKLFTRRGDGADARHDGLARENADLRAEVASLQRAKEDLEFLRSFESAYKPQIIDHLHKSTAQLRQDLAVLSEVGFKRDGFFVEFGATDGVEFSNTHLLEKEFGWKGILAEPARRWHETLRRNRAAPIETRCVWRDSTSKLSFNETEIGWLSTISEFNDSDAHSHRRKTGTVYDVETISLVDMLEKHGAPQEIDFLSIDTEGSEFEILNVFDFEKYKFRIIMCEHNFTPLRERIHDLLQSKGFERRFEHLSKWDDWYFSTNF